MQNNSNTAVYGVDGCSEDGRDNDHGLRLALPTPAPSRPHHVQRAGRPDATKERPTLWEDEVARFQCWKDRGGVPAGMVDRLESK